MYDDTLTKASTKSMMVEDLVNRLAGLRNDKHQWREAGDQLDKRIAEAESEIRHAMEFLKNGLDGPPQMNGQARSESAY